MRFSLNEKPTRIGMLGIRERNAYPFSDTVEMTKILIVGIKNCLRK